MSFENLIGNEEVKQTINKIIQSKKLTHSYMFIGPSGVGKSLFAKEFAKMILCSGEDNIPCNKCKSCIEFDTNNHPDLIEILPDAGNIKIEQIRKMRRKSFRKANNIRKKSIYNKRCRLYDKGSG